MEIFLISLVLVLLAVILVLLLRPKKIKMPEMEDYVTELRLKLDSLASTTVISASDIKDIYELLRKLPREVLDSITGSLSKRSGRLHELMATFELTHYDRLFYLGEPVDFVGIKYDETVDFIEVKTGKFRLRGDEQKLRELIDSKRVNYVPLSVEKIGMAEEVDMSEPGYPPPQ
jgi:Predicted secreted endonuclease distantly related to archaeal Holliday junction resolvase